ncbi:hypothetical protein J45TS6_16580 [Paenibacillus sp. J45TS6]|uniref:hypothetical protein n=1 Tax=Paenibacillus sp. J45TS6 TaxID=2807196 RepID=UPI001B1DBA09|nr:hypothetical protein [Paenibacillus sp. J45TS6]GIP43199.1 hypothetical protein J45TS6_16580 [Paenibacillus sp. J45TS6]
MFIVTYLIGNISNKDPILINYSGSTGKEVDKLADELTQWAFMDVGDDPSFFAAKQFNHNITWGICRLDVRNSLKESDTVLFFGAKKETNEMHYYFIGWATVLEKIKQTDIWIDERYFCFQKNSNLLINKKVNNEFCYEEKILKKYDHRKEWLWKISSGKKGTKKGILSLSKKSKTIPNAFDVHSNYVIFSNSAGKTVIFSNPIKVATYSEKMDSYTEEWDQNPIAQEIKKLIFSYSKRDSLRINNYMRHRHIRISLDEEQENLFFISLEKIRLKI